MPFDPKEQGKARWSRRNTAPVIMLSILGNPADDLLRFLTKVSIKHHLGKSAEYTFSFQNPSRKLLDDPRFFPNQTWRFRHGFLNDLSPVLEGIIRNIEPVYDESVHFSVTLFDALLSVSRKSSGKNWGRVPSSDIAKAIAKQHGLSADVENSNDRPAQSWIQPADVNDLRYLRDLAAMIDFELFVEGSPPVLHYRAKPYGSAPVGRLIYFNDFTELTGLKSFKPKVKSLGPPATKANTTDSKKGKGDGAKTKDPSGAAAGMAAVASYNQEGVERQVIAPSSAVAKALPSNANAKKIVEAVRQQMLDRANEADSEHVYSPSFTVGTIWDIQGLDTQLNGKWYIHGVTHELSGTSQSTKVEWKRNATNGKGKKLDNRNNKAPAGGAGPKVTAVFSDSGVDHQVVVAGEPPPVPSPPKKVQ